MLAKNKFLNCFALPLIIAVFLLANPFSYAASETNASIADVGLARAQYIENEIGRTLSAAENPPLTIEIFYSPDDGGTRAALYKLISNQALLTVRGQLVDSGNFRWALTPVRTPEAERYFYIQQRGVLPISPGSGEIPINYTEVIKFNFTKDQEPLMVSCVEKLAASLSSN
jgi:hypothetical protein